MRIIPLAGSIALLSGCAFPGAVQRVGVEYNTAIAGMANDVTLLNILRASEDLPLHYTAVSRLTGTVILKSGGSINAGFRGNAVTDTNQTVDTLQTTDTVAVAPNGTTDTNSEVKTLATTLGRQLVSGGTVTTPSISGEISTGPSFDIAMLDTQKFYNGILAAIPFSTVENYIGQGFSDQLLMRLLIERIDFKAKDGSEKKYSWKNDPKSNDFAEKMADYNLVGKTVKKPVVNLAPVSRLRRPEGSAVIGISLQELALLDGKTLELSNPIGANDAGDKDTIVRRPEVEKRIAELKPINREALEKRRYPAKPPADELVFLGDGKALVLDSTSTINRDKEIEVEMSIVFRSTESVIRFVGEYLEYHTKKKKVSSGSGHLFSVVPGKPAKAVASAEVLGKRYSIADDNNRRQNMKVIAIIQQLVNLHKESADRPTTVPVQVVGG